jgi:hypothetical protein
MNEFLVNLTSVNWWLGVVAVSLIVNLISAYAKPPLDRLLSKWSDQRKESVLHANKATEKYLQRLLAEPRLHYITLAAESRARQQALISLILSVLLFASMGALTFFMEKQSPPSTPVQSFLFVLPILLPGFFALINSMSAHSKAIRYGAYMWELEKRLLREA